MSIVTHATGRAFPDGVPQFRDIRGRITPDARLAPFTWFRVGGTAELLFQPADANDLATFLAQLDADVPVTVVGVGSNLLVRDGGVAGVVVRLSARGFGFVERREGPVIRAGAALADKRLAAAALEHSVAGLEFYHGIPGTIGGALRMNAGANGAETVDVFASAEAVTRAGERLTFDRAAMGFAYRHTAVDDGIIFTAGVFEGRNGTEAGIRAAMEDVAGHRERAQPIREKTGGSTFTNPAGHRAWELIDAAGCRGRRHGAAQVSEKHCNFLINLGTATAHDLESLGEEVRGRVLAVSGVRLTWEIRRIGRFAGEPIEEFLQP